MGFQKGRPLIEVRFYGDKLLLRSLVTDGTLKPERRGGKVLFRLVDIKFLVDRVSELEALLGEMRDRIEETIGQQGNGESLNNGPAI